VNDCKPSCAQGKFHTFKVRLTLRHRTTCTTGPKRQFRRVRLTFPGKRPSGARKVNRYDRVCSGGQGGQGGY
jgi:hypothetical protein